MARLGWLGWTKGSSGSEGLRAIQSRVKLLLPDDESVVHRYIVIVSVLLTRVAQCDGEVRRCEIEHLGVLFRHVDRMPAEGIDGLCGMLTEFVPRLSEHEVAICFRELKSLCNASERLEVMRLLAGQAAIDGILPPRVHEELVSIANGLDVPTVSIEELEIDALSVDAPPVMPVGRDAGPTAKDRPT